MRPPIQDYHIRLQPAGRMLDALRDFSRAGGTHVVLSHLPYEEVPIVREEDFKESYQITLDIADRARRETDVKVFVTVGPYPVLLLGLEKKYGLSRATEIMKRGMETAQSLVREKRAVALGEIGRPHFPVTPELMSASNDILLYGMQLAAEASCPVVLHTESATPQVMEELGRMADRAGLSREKVASTTARLWSPRRKMEGCSPRCLPAGRRSKKRCPKDRASSWKRISWTTPPARGRSWPSPPFPREPGLSSSQGSCPTKRHGRSTRRIRKGFTGSRWSEPTGA